MEGKQFIMAKVEQFLDYMRQNYIFTDKLLSDDDLIREYLYKLNDPYLKYISVGESSMNIFDMLGIRVEYLSSTMAKIKSFIKPYNTVLKQNDIIFLINDKFPYEFSIKQNDNSEGIINITAIRMTKENNIKIVRDKFTIPYADENKTRFDKKIDTNESIIYIKCLDCNEGFQDLFSECFFQIYDY